jgi:hypothetical protein
MASGNGQQYHVHCSGAVAKSLKELQIGASPARRKQIALAFQTIVDKLQIAAHEVGEELYRLPTLKMQIRAVIVPPLTVVFGVCENKPHVFIRRGRLLGGD